MVPAAATSVSWCIWYEDGSTYTDADGSPFDAPRLGVQVVTERDDRVGWRFVQGGDYFYYEPERGGWHSSDTMTDHLIRAKRPLVLWGRQMADKEWHELFNRVREALGPKQGWLVTESRRGN